MHLDLNYGLDRNEIRQRLNYTEPDNKGRYENEDSFENVLGSNDWLRLGFDDLQKLVDIEILAGSVLVEGIAVEVMGDLKGIVSKLIGKGYEFSEGEYSFTCESLKIDLGDSKKNGGIDNKIYWFYTAKEMNF